MRVKIRKKMHNCKIAISRGSWKSLSCKATKKRGKGPSKAQTKRHEAIYKNFNPLAVDGYRRRQRKFRW